VSSVAPPACSHDLGPGIIVCLRCRQEERELARSRQRRRLTRAGLTLAGLVVVAVLGNSVVNALRASAKERAREPFQLLASTTMSTVRQQGAPSKAVASANAGTPNAGTPTVVAPISAPAARPARGLTLMIPVGRTGLRDSMYVERDADSAVVHFDTELGRTRRRDKFENVVRTTLPLLYGGHIDSLLAALPEGAIAGGRDLVNEVAVHGVRLPIPTGGTLELWPVTRPGRDGPLVVGYRVRATP
jgi:hypothetical protein